MNTTSNDVISPDGSLRVEFEENEYAMSHWVRSPRITDAESGEILLDLWGGTLWDGQVSFGGGGEVALSLRRYPGDRPGFTVRIDPRVRTFYFEDLPERREPLSHFRRRLGQRHRAQGGGALVLRRCLDYLRGLGR